MAESQQPEGPDSNGPGASQADPQEGEPGAVEAQPSRAEADTTPIEVAALPEPPQASLPKGPQPRPEPLRPAMGVSGKANARMTLFGTALVFSVTFVAWGGAKVACNLHPPRNEAFKPAPITRLAATPKDGALEFHHRLAIRDFEGAKELATPDGVPLVMDAQAACDSECRDSAKERKESVLTRAVVLERQGPTALVRAESFFEGEVDARTYRVAWQDRLWKVTAREQ